MLMLSRQPILLFLLLLGFFAWVGATDSQASAAGNEDKSCTVCSYEHLDSNCSFAVRADWSFLLFTSTWPGTFCGDGCCRLPTGLRSLGVGFTIHGLWPNYAGLEYPTCCDCPFDRSDIVSLLKSDAQISEKLREYWPVLKRCDFLQYEYEKHGTCAASVYNGPEGPLDYFRAAINLRERLDFFKILSGHGIKMSPKDRPLFYDLHREILPAIEKAIGVKVIIGCEAGGDHVADLLADIRVCVARDSENRLNPAVIDCPDNLIEKETTCNASPHGIRLPMFPTLEEQSRCSWP